MFLIIAVVLLAIIGILFMMFVKMSAKICLFLLILMGIIFTLVICFKCPTIHNPFVVNIIEYIVKFSDK